MASQNDIEALFKEKFTQTQSIESARNFLMRIVKVNPVKGDPDAFMALGYRVGTEQKVGVLARKAREQQHIPEVGGVMRAEKTKRVPSSNSADVLLYKADHYHAYLKDSFCLSAVIQPGPARRNGDTNQWQAQVHAYDLEVNDKLLPGNQFIESAENVLTRMLMPWKEPNPSSITHDVKNDPLWGDGVAGKRGMSPFATIRVLGQSFAVYGRGHTRVDHPTGTEYLLPTEEEVRGHIRANPKLAALTETLKSLPQKELHKLSIAFIPGVSISVGRDSLSGSDRRYLAIPQAFEFQAPSPGAESGETSTQTGFRAADVHIKVTRSFRMIVSSAVKSEGSRLSQALPESSQERLFRERKEARATVTANHGIPPAVAYDPESSFNDLASAFDSQPSSSLTQRTETAPVTDGLTRQSVIQRDHAPIAVEHGQPDYAPSVTGHLESAESFDVSIYADDLAAMESMGSGSPASDDSNDFDDLLRQEANQRTEEQPRVPRPSMG